MSAQRELPVYLDEVKDKERRARRERIATAALTGVVATEIGLGYGDANAVVKHAVRIADLLIAELDR